MNQELSMGEIVPMALAVVFVAIILSIYGNQVI